MPVSSAVALGLASDFVLKDEIDLSFLIKEDRKAGNMKFIPVLIDKPEGVLGKAFSWLEKLQMLKPR